ncbi:MAG: hypothetical protein KDD51_14175 [Bdellovibrionales bacterium]|nr:hypothetical protein [Bdellovibrionales bacterium]
MKNLTIKQFLFGLTVLISLVLLGSCGGSGSGSSSNSYAGPGSDWSAQLFSDNSFTITESTNSLTVNGTYSRLSSGFIKLTVSSATGTGAPSPGDIAYGLDVPGFVFFLKPLSGDQVIAMVSSGSCPSGGLDFNWVSTNVESSVSNIATKDTYGTFTWDQNSGSTSVSKKYAVNAPTTDLGSQALSTLTCSSGVGSTGTAKMYFTSGGGAIVNTNTSDASTANFIVAMEKEPISAASDLDGNWVGLVFDEGAASDKVKPISASASSGTFTVSGITPDTGAASGAFSDTYTLSNLNLDGNNGMFLFTASGSGKLGCIADITIQESSSKKVLLCAGQSKTTATKLSNLLLVYKP